MRILIAGYEQNEMTNYYNHFRKYGTVDIANSLLDAVVLYANCCSAGSKYNLVLLNQSFSDTSDGIAIIETFRKYEILSTGNQLKTIICFSTEKGNLQNAFELKHGNDVYTQFHSSPANLNALEQMAKNIASSIEMRNFNHTPHIPRSIVTKA